MVQRDTGGGAMGLYSSSKARRHLSSGSKDREDTSSAHIEENTCAGHSSVLLQVDFAEISLEDVEEDGPVLRAALANLDRRTTSLKKTAKATVKAAQEVRASLCQLQASEADLHHCLETCAHLHPSTMGYLQTKLMEEKHKEADKSREEEKEMLHSHVEAPLLGIIDMCRTIQEQSKSFELESRLYYAGTQKWLSSRSSAQSSATLKEANEMYSSSAVGYDRASVKQERVDDKQRLRQARFHLARLEIFRAVINVHGGEAELQMASHVLALCRWQCSDRESRAVAQVFEAALQAERAKVRRRSEEVQAKYAQVERQLTELQGTLGVAALDMDVEVGAHLPSSESEHALSAKTRQTGNRIRNLISSLSHNKQAAQHHTQEFDYNSPTKRSSLQFRSNGIFDSAQSAPAVAAANQSFGKQQQRSRRLSYAECQTPSRCKETPASDDLRSAALCRSASIGAASAREDDFYPFARSSSPRRSSSISNAIISPRRRVFSSAAGNLSSPAVKRRSFGGGRVSSDAHKAMEIASEATPEQRSEQPSKKSLLQPRRAAQQSRKREGILWAMSKPVAGAGGADAPKSASRSTNWRECWVVLSGSGHLGQYAEWKDVKVMEPSQPLIDLRFATVREARGVERRFTFEVVTRENRRFFQANNEDEMKNWMSAISCAIESLLNGTSSIRQIDKVARVACAGSPFASAGNEFGSQAGLGGLEPSALGRHRAFSQSLTDLSSASNVKLFSRGSNREETTRKRDSKGSGAVASGHLAALSEGNGPYTNASVDPSAPSRQSLWSQHDLRGISNKTPVSGYVQQLQGDVVENTTTIQSSWTTEPDYDRMIEEMVHSSYGGSNHAHRKSASFLSSTSPTRQSSQASQSEAAVAAAATTMTRTAPSASTRYTRSKEIVDIASRSDNGYCADCRRENPRWASWSLNGEPRCIFICITCSGHHRGLGVGVSRVKSVDLDEWTEEQMQSARQWGNNRVNAIYEAKKPMDPSLTMNKDGRYWLDKYVDRIWFDDGSAATGMYAGETRDEQREYAPTRKVEAGLPRWPSSPPVVYVSLLEGDDEELGQDPRKWGASLNLASISTDKHTSAATPQVSLGDDPVPFPSSSPPLLSNSYHRFPRRSIERRAAVG